MTETNHAYLRYWYLHELMRIRASLDNGSADAKATSERKSLQRKLLEVRRTRPGYEPSTRPVVAKRQAATPAAPTPKPASGKGAILMALLEQGTTLDAICQATGWLPHSAGARISGVKKTHTVIKDGNNYRIA